MNRLTTYIVTCGKCKSHRKIAIIDMNQVDWLNDSGQESIVSARKRLDGQWGFQCTCGNDDILTEQEIRTITNKVNPDMKEIQEVIDNLKFQKPKFDMVVV